MVKWFSQRVSRKIALLALMMVALVFVAGVTGALIFFVLFVPAFLCELVADPQFRGGNLQQFLVSVSEPYPSSLFERPPPISLA
jgi:hypothetical protein